MEQWEHFFAIVTDALNMEEGASIDAVTELEGIDGWDSLGKFMLLSSIYSDYGVTLEVEDVNGAKTVGDLWKLVEDAGKS